MDPPTTLAEQIGQLISIRIGSNMPPMTTIADDYERVAALVERLQLGGLLLFNGGRASAAAATLDRIQALVRIPVLVGIDMERGCGQQISDHPVWPHALAFDRLGETAADRVENFARLSAAAARSLGIHLSFSPVADIHRNPRNPIIANRAFGRTPDRAGQLAAAYVRGCRAGGLLSCAKHFPGHGNTFEDSHAALPIVRESAEELAATDLYPFRGLISEQVDMMMSAHVSYPALDDSGAPATLSKPILTGMLRDEWGFQGVVVSDSLKMDGVRRSQGSEAHVAIAAIKAGVDLLLDVTDVENVISKIAETAAADGELLERIHQSANRLVALKQDYFARTHAADPPSREECGADALDVARTAITVTANDGRVPYPITSGRVAALVINPNGDNAYTDTKPLISSLQSNPWVESLHVLDDKSPELDWQHVQSQLARCDYGFIALVVKPAAWQDSSLPPHIEDALVQATQKCPAVVASLGIPDVLAKFTGASLAVATYSDVPSSQQALLEFVLGQRQRHT